MRLVLCGTRGSTPAPGPAFVRYGGNTSCVSLAHDGEPPSLALDAGTGLTRLGDLLDGRPFRGSIVLSHLHWDHTHGLPFFPAGDHPGAVVDLHMPAQGDAEAVLSRAMSPPHFPITPSQLRGRWGFHGLEEGSHAVAGFSVLAREVPHKGGRTFGYRVSDGTATIAYVPDHDPLVAGPGPDGHGEYHEAVRALAEGVDLLLHDAQFTVPELAARGSFGHSVIDYPVGLAGAAGARALLLFHHAPRRTDEELDAIAAAHGGGPLPVSAAAEGQVIDLGS